MTWIHVIEVGDVDLNLVVVGPLDEPAAGVVGVVLLKLGDPNTRASDLLSEGKVNAVCVM